ncbi:MAG TPA: OmpA family protein [Kofleriaceae bacterium]|jgi:peptidoglycan-associated lipoprotein
MSRYLLLAAVLVACHHDKAVKTTPVEPVAQTPPAQPPPPPQQDSKPVSSNLNAGADLIKLCNLRASSEQQAAPKFSYNEFQLTSQDRDVLQQIATCVTRGPAKGHRLQLTGRADPRGTEEYNMGLGDHRANSVGTYLEHLGVSTSAVSSSTRGALDATGTDESGWQMDRRVDLELD